MKKIILLFTIICAGQLYGMEEAPKMGAFGDLPEDVHKVIVQALATSNNLEQTIEAIKVASVLRGVRYDNLKDFTKLVHILADKFNTTTAKIAKEFKTPIAEKYVNLGNDLTFYMLMFDKDGNIKDPDRFTQLINQGADVNYTGTEGSIYILGKGDFPDIQTPLIAAVKSGNSDLVKLLLNSGANPYYKTPAGTTALDEALFILKAVRGDTRNTKEDIRSLEMIKALLEEAMEKQPQQ